jgi:hypothetical protein
MNVFTFYDQLHTTNWFMFAITWDYFIWIYNLDCMMEIHYCRCWDLWIAVLHSWCVACFQLFVICMMLGICTKATTYGWCVKSLNLVRIIQQWSNDVNDCSPNNGIDAKRIKISIIQMREFYTNSFHHNYIAWYLALHRTLKKFNNGSNKNIPQYKYQVMARTGTYNVYRW